MRGYADRFHCVLGEFYDSRPYLRTSLTQFQLSAGGSLVHPEIPAILITPLCPHTLSFRPMLLPDTMELRICVPFNSRSTAWASFDGRGRVELKRECL